MICADGPCHYEMDLCCRDCERENCDQECGNTNKICTQVREEQNG